MRALAYMFAYLWAVRVSGAHFNPATTLAVYLKNKDKQAENLRYTWIVMIVQLIGAFIGVLFVFLVLKDYNAPFNTLDFSPSKMLTSMVYPYQDS